MPTSVTIDLPLVISPRGGLTLVRPIGFPSIALASSSEELAVAAVRRRVTDSCKHRVGSELVASLVRGFAEQRAIVVQIAPQKRSLAWREPIDVRLDMFVFRQDDTLVIAYLPALDLTVVATPRANLQNLVQEQIRSAIRRRGAWSLVGLAGLDPSDESTLRHERLEVAVTTPTEHARQHSDKPRSKTPTLKAVATLLKRKSLRAAYHRDHDVERLAQLLSADQPRSVLLVGPSGVGKTAIFHQWVRNRDRYGMKSWRCWATDGSRLISGQGGFGMWQQQCLQMAEEACKYPSVVHLGNLVELSESGRLRGSGGCGSLLAHRLANGSLKGVLECTAEQLTRIRRVEPRLIASLTILQVDEPTPEQTRSILLEAAAAWRPVDISARLKKSSRKTKRKGPSRRSSRVNNEQPLPLVDPEALQMLDRLHRRFRTDAASPGRPLSFFHAVMSELKSGQTLDPKRVIAAFGRQTGLPSFLIDDSVRPDLDSVQRQLASQVIGQDAVIEILVDMIATLAADLARPDRPLASLMLIGPTGVGKTETAKALARLIYSDISRLVRIDMSELSTSSAVGRLIGDALHPEGVLTSAVRAQPFSLVLLDEFEKAHASVFDLLLQVLGEGRLTDGRGRLADFRNSIVLMTSNLGVDTFRATPLGLAETQHKERYRNHFHRHVRDFLRPEMFNRIDRILAYDPLDEATVQKIARLRLDELQRRDGWKSRGRPFDVDEQALRVLARDGYQVQYGARPLARELERRLAAPLSEAICESGRMSRLVAKVGVQQQGDGAIESVSVRVTADPAASSQPDDSLEMLIEQMTLLRRRGQSLDRCDAVRLLRNQHTILTRKIKSLIREGKSTRQRNRIRYGPLGVHRMQTRERIEQVRLLCQDIDSAEAALLLKYYRGEEIDRTRQIAQLEQLRERMWAMLCELHSESAVENQRMTLILTGPNLMAAGRLLEAYRFVAAHRGWVLQVHALLKREQGSGHDRIIDCEGWSQQPAFRIAVQRDHVAQLLQEFTVEQKPQPSLAAYRLIRFAALTAMPVGTLGLMLTFRGKAASLAMASEIGVHTFNRLHQPRSAGHSLLVSKHSGMPIEYVAPDWLPLGDFQMIGHPRRWYDGENDLVQDMTQDGSRSLKMDREGRWLDRLIEQETERRIWSELDDQGGESSSDPDVTVALTY